MTSTRNRVTVAIAIASALLLGPALTGCGMVEGLIEQASGGAVDLGGNSVPDDFPDDVPLIDGEVIYGLGINGDDGAQGWNVTIKVDGVEAYDEISSELTDAGFEALSTQNDDSGQAAGGAFSSDDYGVVVAVTGDDSAGWVANYTVTETNS